MSEWSHCYNFLSQYVFLTDRAPSQMGVVDEDRIFIVYEGTGRIELYKVSDDQRHKSQSSAEVAANGTDVNTESEASAENDAKPSYELELTIPLFDVDIVQVIHCPIDGGYFAFYTNNRLNRSQSVRVYSNWKNHYTNDCNELHTLPANGTPTMMPSTSPSRTPPSPLSSTSTTTTNGPTLLLSQQAITSSYEQLFSVRLAGELFSLARNDPDESQRLFNKISQCLNVLELSNCSKNDWPVQFIARCKITGTIVVTLRNSKVMLYRYVRCISHRKSNIHTADGQFVDGGVGRSPIELKTYAIDFVQSHTVALLESSWIPEVAKLSLNYLALMSNSHFALLRLQFDDDKDNSGDEMNENLEHGQHNPLIIEFSTVKSHSVRRQADDFPLRSDVQIVFNSLFDSPPQKDIHNGNENANECSHSEIVYGPVSDKLTCKIAVFAHRHHHCSAPREDVTGSESTAKIKSTDTMNGNAVSQAFDLLICRSLRKLEQSIVSPRRNRQSGALDNFKIDLLELGSLRERFRAITDGEFKKAYHFGFDLAPIKDKNSGLVIAHCLYILFGFQLDCYLVDLRRDSLKLVPISHLELKDKEPMFGSFTSSPIIRDICFCPQQDLIHILTSQSLETYCTHFYEFLATNSPQNLERTRHINTSPLLLACNRFLNQIALLANEKFLFLISNQGEANRHTIYGLRRPELYNVQRDTAAVIEEFKQQNNGKSNQKEEALMKLFHFNVSNCQFALRHGTLSQSEQEMLRTIVEEIDNEKRNL